VESVSGVETLKAMAVEPQMRQRWEEQLAAYVRASFRTITLGTVGSQGVQLISKVVTALVLWFGAHAVIAGDLTVGQLVAFNMLAGQVNQPILRLAQLWQVLVEPSAPDNKYTDYFYITRGSPGELRMPLEPGAYELRYVQGGSKVLVRRMITVETVPASISGPYEAIAGETIKIAAKKVVKFRVAKACKDAILGSR